MDFSVLNESSLHKKLKEIYALEYNGKTEVCQNDFIYDILTQENEIIEIQTQNLSKLYKKVKKSLELNYKTTIVYPLPAIKFIETYDENGILVSRRKSPKKENIYSIFKQLTKLYPFLDNPHFILEVLEVSITEKRILLKENVQSKNKRRRFCKNWLKTDKELNEIFSKSKFSKKSDYLNLLPENLPELFSTKDLKSNKAIKDPNMILWVLEKAGFIKFEAKEKKLKLYTINKS